MSNIPMRPVQFVGYPPEMDRDPSVFPEELPWDYDAPDGGKFKDPQVAIEFEGQGHLFVEEPYEPEDPSQPYWRYRWDRLTDMPPRTGS